MILEIMFLMILKLLEMLKMINNNLTIFFLNNRNVLFNNI